MAIPPLNALDALLVVDVQRDFCPGGALPAQGCDQMIAAINRWIAAAGGSASLIVASRDWHPANHLSFESQGGPWPTHCVQNSPGAAFHETLELPDEVHVVSKGTNPDTENYSAFDGTGLTDWLREQGIQRVWIGGVALEVCVRASALDAVRAGFETHLITEATAPVDAKDGQQAIEEMQHQGVILES